MIRPLTLLTLLAAGGAGLHLYQVKHQVSLLDKELREVRARTEAARTRTGVLRAEWQLLNDPERLRRNAAQFLQLETMSPAQFIRSADLDKRLPLAIAFVGPRSPFAAPVDVAEEDASSEGAARQMAAAPEPAAPRPDALLATPRPTSIPATVLASRPAGRPAEPSARPEMARLTEPAASRAVPRTAFVAPRPAMAPPVPAPYRPVPSLLASANAAPAAQASYADGPSSALGGGRPALAPPVPVGPAAALPPGYGAR